MLCASVSLRVNWPQVLFIYKKSTFMPIYRLWTRSTDCSPSVLARELYFVFLFCWSFWVLTTFQHKRDKTSSRVLDVAGDNGHSWAMDGVHQTLEHDAKTFESQVNH